MFLFPCGIDLYLIARRAIWLSFFHCSKLAVEASAAILPINREINQFHVDEFLYWQIQKGALIHFQSFTLLWRFHIERKLIFFIILVVIVAGSIFITLGLSQKATADKTALIKKGEYLVTISGCNDCHSPKIFTSEGPVPDAKRLMSGHPANAKLPPGQ